ncbi:MAG TPA: GPR1/FUN34/YaaH family transporter [Mycobacteriales bacterium]|nr:GPR1/FUN34/YaaH family transporter [Mycobacteriales bacterium]
MSQIQPEHRPATPTAPEVRELVEGPPAPAPAPTGVVLGAGGDPLIVGLPIFAVGSLTLGMALVGVVDQTALGGIVPIVLFGTGLFLAIVTVWAAVLAQTIVAGICGTFSGFWLSLGALLLGLQHNWYGVPAGQIASTQEMFFTAWGCLFLFLLIPCLMLPAVYPAVVALVVAALALAAASAHTGEPNLLKAAGYVTLVFAFLGFCAFVNVGLTAMGAKRPFPPLGPPILS